MKRFLKTLIAMFAVFALVIAAVGCTGEQEPPPDVKLDDLIGTWVFTKDSGEYIEISFKKNMRYTKRDTTGGNGTNSMGDFELNKNKVTLIPSEGTDKTIHEITKFDGDTMVWGSGSFAREYKKK